MTAYRVFFEMKCEAFAADVELAGALDDDTALLEERGELAVHDGGADL